MPTFAVRLTLLCYTALISLYVGSQETSFMICFLTFSSLLPLLVDIVVDDYDSISLILVNLRPKSKGLWTDF